MLSGMGKLLIFAGVVFILIGSVIILANRIGWIGRLPGDIYIQRENFSFYFPITTCILISIIISLIFIFLGRR